MSDPVPPKGDASASPRIGFRGSAKRDRSIFREDGEGWVVEVTPVQLARGVEFEVRAEFMGRPLEAFNTHRVGPPSNREEAINLPDYHLALKVAGVAERALRRGERDLYMPRLVEIAKALP